MKNKRINNKILKLWHKYFKDDKKVYGPLLYDNFKGDGLVFVGINPSFSPTGHKAIFKDTEFSKLDPKKIFLWKNISKDSKSIDVCIETEKLAFERHSYFRIMHKMSKELGIHCDHVDLFLYKLTSQEDFKKLVWQDGELNQFAKDQLSIFDESLTAANPRVVVVANAHGSEIVRSYYKERITFDDRKGYHYFKLSNGKDVPMFFSSMISGQRSLDVWSRERLQWHIGQALKQK